MLRKAIGKKYELRLSAVVVAEVEALGLERAQAMRMLIVYALGKLEEEATESGQNLVELAARLSAAVDA